MKKILFIIVTVIAIQFFATKAYSCPDGPGWFQTIISMQINGCWYDIELCVKCPIAPGEIEEFQIFGITKVATDPPCIQSWTIAEVQNYAINYVKENFNTYSLCIGIPPCGTEQYTWSYIVYHKCWQKETLQNGDIHYFVCMTANCSCNELWKFCYDVQNDRVIPTLDSGPDSNCPEPNWICPDAEPVDPPSGITTGCFYIGTPCD